MGARMALGVCMLSSESAPTGGRCQDRGRGSTGFPKQPKLPLLGISSELGARRL